MDLAHNATFLYLMLNPVLIRACNESAMVDCMSYGRVVSILEYCKNYGTASLLSWDVTYEDSSNLISVSPNHSILSKISYSRQYDLTLFMSSSHVIS